MTSMHYVGAIAVMLLITAAGLFSGMRVKNSKDFATGGKKGGTGIVVGTITGTLIGGASTIGTAQLAVVYGFSAWWFTLGASLGCLTMGLFFTKPLHRSNATTLSGLFGSAYGKKAGLISTLLMSIGSLLTIVAQILSGVALVTSMVPVNGTAAALLIVFLMLAYVVFGGVWGTGIVGIVKLVLLSTSVILCGGLVLGMSGGLSAFWNQLPRGQYFNLLARGPGTDLGAALSLIVGVLTTQTYIQAVISARGVQESKKGALISAALIPPVGIMCVFIGMYVKIHHPEWGTLSALPAFVMAYLPPVAAGAILATLLVTIVGTGAGMALGISSMFTRDVFKAYIRPHASDKHLLGVSRLGIVAVLGGSILLATESLGAMILDWSFLAMGLRGAVAFIPLCCALFMPRRLPSRFAIASMAAGPAFVLLGKLLLPPWADPLFYGIAASAIVACAGIFTNTKGINTTSH